MKHLLTTFRKSIAGAALVELSLILPLLLLMTFGTVEFGYVLYQFNSAQKATQAGARVVSSRTVLEGVSECFVANDGVGQGANAEPPKPAGTSCASVPGALSWAGLTCAGVSGSTNCNAAGMQAVYDEMNAFYPNMTTSDFEVEFGPTGLGYIGRGAPVPSVTVRITNMNYDFVAMGFLVKWFDDSSNFGDSINIASAETTIIGEDMDEGT